MGNDAPAFCLGAVVQQVGSQHIRTTAFSSRTLTEAERRYPTGEHEALACLWACEKWHVYLWGHPFALQTARQVLVALLLVQSTGQQPLRIARWSALWYNVTMQYGCREHNKAFNALSRLPRPDTEGGLKLEEEIVFLVTSVHQEDLQLATAEDSTVHKVVHYVTDIGAAPQTCNPN